MKAERRRLQKLAATQAYREKKRQLNEEVSRSHLPYEIPAREQHGCFRSS
jgi:hypothetical protein